MIVEKIVNWFRNKGYDDFWLADLADTYEVGLFGIMLFLQIVVFCIIVGIGAGIIGLLFGFGEGDKSGNVIIFFIGLFMLPYLCHMSIKVSKEKGKTDLRLWYMVSSRVSKISTKTMKYVPIISVFLLVLFLIKAITQYGFYVKMVIAFALSLLLLLVFAHPYNKLLARVKKEAEYFVDWKTLQEVEQFEETYSRHEKWHIASADLDFEKFNIDHFRNICVSAFMSVSFGLLATLLFWLSYSPMLIRYDKAKTIQTEELYEEPFSGETEEVNSSHTDIEPEESIEPEVIDTVTSKEAEDVNDAAFEEVAIEDKKETEEKDIDVNEKKNTEMQDTRHYHLNELDVQPTMNDGSSLKKGIATYLIEHVTELKGNHVYVAFEISPDGKIIDVDASLVHDRELREKIRNALLSMPNVIPGKKDGNAVYVSTNITIEKE